MTPAYTTELTVEQYELLCFHYCRRKLRQVDRAQ